MKQRLLLAIPVLAALCIVGCGAGDVPAPTASVLARVNGEPITVDQLNLRVRFLNLGFSNVSGNGFAGEAKLDALSQLIDEAIYLQEARRLGISVSDQEISRYIAKLTQELPEGVLDKTLARNRFTMKEFSTEVARKLTIDKLTKSAIYSRTNVDDAQLRRYFDEHREEFNKPMQVRARQIVVDSEESARNILREIKAGADFSTIARQRSLSPDGEAGGDLGYFSRGDMPPEFEEVVFNMKPGEMSGVVHTPYGYHIFIVDDVSKPLRPSFEEVKADVRERYLSAKGEDDYIAWQSALKQRASIELDTVTLGKL